MSVDAALKDLVHEAMGEYLDSFVGRLTDPEPLTYSIPQAAKVLGTSQDTVRRLIAADHLPLVPHMGGRRLIPRTAVERLVHHPCTATPARRIEAVS